MIAPFTLPINLGELWASRRERQKVETLALHALYDWLDTAKSEGLADFELLRMLLIAYPLSHRDDFDDFKLQHDLWHSTNQIMRARAYIRSGVPIDIALKLASLERSAEHVLRGIVSYKEYSAMYEEDLRAKLEGCLEESEHKEGIPHDEIMKHVRASLNKRAEDEYNSDPPLREAIEAELRQFLETGSVPPSLRERVFNGPGTRFIKEDWSTLVMAVITAPPALHKLVQGLRNASEST